jgi:hypothetical protein
MPLLRKIDGLGTVNGGRQTECNFLVASCGLKGLGAGVWWSTIAMREAELRRTHLRRSPAGELRPPG